MVQIEAKAFALGDIISLACPLQHLQITIRVAEGGDGAAADMLVDADGFACFVVDEVDFW